MDIFRLLKVFLHLLIIDNLLIFKIICFYLVAIKQLSVEMAYQFSN